MQSQSRFDPGDRIVVWISPRKDVYEGDSGTVIKIEPPQPNGTDVWRVTAILDTGIKLNECYEGIFVRESDYDPNIPF